MTNNRRKRHNPTLAAFYKEMEQSGHTYETLAPIANLNFRTFSSWGLRTQPRIDQFNDAVQAVGCRLVITRMDGVEQ